MLIHDEESQIFYKKNNQERFAKQRFEYQETNRTRSPKIFNKREYLLSIGVKDPDAWLKDYAKDFK